MSQTIEKKPERRLITTGSVIRVAWLVGAVTLFGMLFFPQYTPYALLAVGVLTFVIARKIKARSRRT